MSQEPIRIAITVDGGLVQEVMTAGIPVEVVIVDYDVEGVTELDLTVIDENQAYLSSYTADDSAPARAFVEHAFALARLDIAPF